MLKRLSILLVLSLFFCLLFVACRRPAGQPLAGAERMLPPPATATPTPTFATVTATPASTTPAAPPIATPQPATPTWPPPSTPPGRFAVAALTPLEYAAATAIAQALPPTRDDIALALSFRGLISLPDLPAATPTVPNPGERHNFWVLNYNDITFSTVEAALIGMSDYAYFWFETRASGTLPDPAAVTQAGTAFDEIFNTVTEIFGPVELPADGRVHILHASPETLCGSAAGCGLAGYFSATDALPLAINANSNERPMFVMNSQVFGSSSYLSVLAHEFRHLVEYEYDRSEADWETEGSAVLAEELAGWPLGAYSSGNAFLIEPDLQLNRWSDNNTYRHYGQGYVLSRYLYQQLGPELYREFAMHPAAGLDALDALAEEHGLPYDSESFWLDWLVALAIHNRPETPSRYQLGAPEMATAAMTTIPEPPFSVETTVNQYAADYYCFYGSGSVTINLEGSTLAPLIPVPPPSGRGMWYAGRDNFSDSRLTRAIDLRNVSQATLMYQVYYDIEPGYDFAYIAASTDGGATWQALVAPGMQSRANGDDPGGTAFAEQFYTGRSDGWVQEQIDLSPYAGQEILLRFSYVTDPVMTFPGLALDNIAIPEIGFYDDGEGNTAGWLAEGFSPATTYLPQAWHVQLVTFPAGEPQVILLQPEADGTLRHTLSLDEAGGEIILIVAASAPDTLEPAAYILSLER